MHRAAVPPVGLAEVPAAGLLPVFGHMKGMTDQFLNALVFGGGNGHHGNAQKLLQTVDLNGAAVVQNLVHHVQRQYHGNIQLNQLHGQVQISLNVGGVYNVDDAGGVLVQQKLPGDHLFAGVGGQGINSRQVGNHGLAVPPNGAVFPVHGNAGEVAHMLIGAGELIEQRGFSAVLVAG